MATFGVTTTDGTELSLADNYKVVSKFTLTENASVTMLSVYMKATASGGPLRGLIYADSSGPAARRAIGAEATLIPNDTYQWYDSAVSVTLAPGDYWLGVILNTGASAAYYKHHNVAGNRKYKAEAYSATPADPFGSVDGTDEDELSIYATYTPLGNPTYTILNGSDEQLLNVNAGGTDVDAATYKDGVQLSESELAALLSASFGKKNVAVLPDLTGVADARQIKKTTFSAETESA